MSKNYVTPIIVISLIVLAGVAWLVWQNSSSGNAARLLTPTPSIQSQPTSTPTNFENSTSKTTETPLPSPQITITPSITISVEPTIGY